MREKAIYDAASAISAAEKRGKTEGEAIAKARETAIKMLSRGMIVEEIADITGLSESEIRSISGKPE